jgi:hypothetical protein
MQTPVSLIQLTIGLPANDYAAYRAAKRMLSRTMGKHAPSVLGLIVNTLRCRDSRGLAEDYLESVNWPALISKKGRVTFSGRRQAVGISERLRGRFANVDATRN